MTNLWTAASDGDVARVQELMAGDAQLGPTTPDEQGYTAVHAAASWGHVELLKVLLSHDNSELANAANVRDNDGDTPLHHLAVSELTKVELKPVISLLLSCRADSTVRNKEEKTCLDAALEDAAADTEATMVRELEGEDAAGEPSIDTTEFAKILEECSSSRKRPRDEA